MKKRILIVDDNDNILDLFEVMLYREFDLTLAVNGFEALDKATASPPDLIITDIAMPVMDGIRLINQLRRNELLAQIPVIAVTSFTQEHTQKSLLAVGFAAVILKPFTQKEAMPAIKQAMKPSP